VASGAVGQGGVARADQAAVAAERAQGEQDVRRCVVDVAGAVFVEDAIAPRVHGSNPARRAAANARSTVLIEHRAILASIAAVGCAGPSGGG